MLVKGKPMKLSPFVVAISLMATPVFAQDASELAIEYANLPAVQDMMTDMFSPETMRKQVEVSLPPNISLTEEQLQQIGLLMSEKMNTLRPKVQEIMISSSSEVFSAGELRALIDFHSSEHGAAVMAKTTPFMTNVMNQLQPEIRALQVEIGPDIAKIMQN